MIIILRRRMVMHRSFGEWPWDCSTSRLFCSSINPVARSICSTIDMHRRDSGNIGQIVLGQRQGASIVHCATDMMEALEDFTDKIANPFGGA
jgi:hypothetical protein